LEGPADGKVKVMVDDVEHSVDYNSIRKMTRRKWSSKGGKGFGKDMFGKGKGKFPMDGEPPGKGKEVMGQVMDMFKAFGKGGPGGMPAGVPAGVPAGMPAEMFVGAPPAGIPLEEISYGKGEHPTLNAPHSSPGPYSQPEWKPQGWVDPSSGNSGAQQENQWWSQNDGNPQEKTWAS
jgi:hypothetical protein